MPYYAKLLLLVSVVLLNGCTSSSDDKSNDEAILVETVKSTLNRDLSPVTDASNLDLLVKRNNAFAFDFFNELQKSENGNLFISPISISTALAMTYAGADGQTKSEMANALHFDINDTELFSSFNALDMALNVESNESNIFDEVNTLWPQKDYPFKESYLDTIMLHFGASLYPQDYVNNPDQARETINAFVQQKTRNRITNLLQPGDVTSQTRLIITNTVYFLAEWKIPFDEEETEKELFYNLDGETTSLDMMQNTSDYLYSEENGYQAIELPYINGLTSMLVILPEEGMWDDFLDEFNVSEFNTLLSSMQMKSIDLKFPKFTFTTPRYNIVENLQNLGMEQAFSGSADFSRMSSEQLTIDKVLHKAFISVNENTTEAAAATAVVIGDIAADPTEIKTMYVDRPFLFMIKDTTYNQILFMGYITDMSGI